jgi:PAS domain S-box-containing protein
MHRTTKQRQGMQVLDGIAGALPVPILVFDAGASLTRVNREFMDLFGMEAKDLLGRGWLERLDVQDRTMMSSILSAAVAAEQPFHCTCRVRVREDVSRTCELAARVWKTGKNLSGYVATLVDVTARDNAACRVQGVADSLRELSHRTRDMYVEIGPDGRIRHWNIAMAQCTGRTEEEMIGQKLPAMFQSTAIDGALAEVCSTRQTHTLRNVSLSGRSMTLACTFFPVGTGCGILLTPDTESTGNVAFDALRRSEEGLRQSEERYRAFIEDSSEGIWRFETEAPIPIVASVSDQVRLILAHGYVAECNDTLARFYGYAHATDLINARVATIVQAGAHQAQEHIERFVLSGYRLANVEVSRRDTNGEIRYLQYSFAGTVERGCLIRAWGVIRDATERRDAERRLRLLAHTLTSTRDAISITDVENRILFVNDAFVRTYGYAEEELIGQSVSLVRSSSTPPGMDALIHSATLHGEWNGEILNRRADGSDFPVELWTSVVRNDEGDPVAMVGVARDITERKRTDENLRASLREKEVLLKEIHHRVKNNLQVISSLLSLQAEYLTDEGMLRILRESQSRVKSMALVHEKLYQSNNLAEIDFGDYVRELVMQLFRSYGMRQEVVHMAINADAISLGVDRAIPAGIIVNELVTNALKYAFPNGQAGTIVVELRSIAAGVVRVVIRDDGVGFPKGLGLDTAGSLGLTLVHMLTDQLRGELTMPPQSSGAEFVLTFRK